MVYRLIFIFLTLFCPMVLGMSPARGQAADNSDRQYWVQTIIKIADPVINNLSKDQLKKKIHIGRSSSALASSREFVTHMESVGRTIAGIAPWLELGPDETPEGKLREKYIKMTCKALANSVNPKSNDYFNSTATRQRGCKLNCVSKE